MHGFCCKFSNYSRTFTTSWISQHICLRCDPSTSAEIPCIATGYWQTERCFETIPRTFHDASWYVPFRHDHSLMFFFVWIKIQICQRFLYREALNNCIVVNMCLYNIWKHISHRKYNNNQTRNRELQVQKLHFLQWLQSTRWLRFLKHFFFF